MQPEAVHHRRLEQRVRILEEENRALRAELDAVNRSSGSLPDEASASEVAVAESISGRIAESGATQERTAESISVLLDSEDKIRLFQSRFTGRTDLYARRWENHDGTKKGYAPVCANEWRKGICKKPVVSCHECTHRAFEPITDTVIREHLTGKKIVGLYALDKASRCRFIVADFDHDGWQDDTRALVRTCRQLEIPALCEISRSGDGAHVWFFFDSPVPAATARQLVTALIERTCRQEKLLSLSSHDRLIPNQDMLSGAGFGSLVALPLQRAARDRDASVFVDDELVPLSDQWQALEGIQLVHATTIQSLIERVEDGQSDVASYAAQESRTPWKRSGGSEHLPPITQGDLPASLPITMADGVYVERTHLPQPLVYAIARLAAFANPHWHELERVHRSTWNIARFVDKSQLLAKHIRVPRGCSDAVLELLGRYTIDLCVQDERVEGSPLRADFTGKLLSEQKTALDALLAHDTGVLHAPPGFGKTVTAAAVISQRACSTLVIVHTTALLRQWQSRLSEFLSVEPSDIGTLGGGRKRRLTGSLDVAGVRSLARLDDNDLAEVLDKYGHVIVDECHHAGAATHTRVLEASHAKYVLGLTATPTRRDGLEPIVFMHCGPVRHHVAISTTTPIARVLERIEWSVVPDTTSEAPIQDVLSAVANDTERTAMIAAAAVKMWRLGRKVLVLTERRNHIDALIRAFNEVPGDAHPVPLVLHGKLTIRARRETMERLEELDDVEPRCLVATGRLVGEGFDHPALDTVVFAMPFAWRGTLQQYLGRLARSSRGKHDIRVIDVHDTGHPMLESMWRKRRRGYRALGWGEAKGGELF